MEKNSNVACSTKAPAKRWNWNYCFHVSLIVHNSLSIFKLIAGVLSAVTFTEITQTAITASEEKTQISRELESYFCEIFLAIYRLCKSEERRKMLVIDNVRIKIFSLARFYWFWIELLRDEVIFLISAKGNLIPVPQTYSKNNKLKMIVNSSILILLNLFIRSSKRVCKNKKFWE